MSEAPIPEFRPSGGGALPPTRIAPPVNPAALARIGEHTLSVMGSKPAPRHQAVSLAEQVAALTDEGVDDASDAPLDDEAVVLPAARPALSENGAPIADFKPTRPVATNPEPRVVPPAARRPVPASKPARTMTLEELRQCSDRDLSEAQRPPSALNESAPAVGSNLAATGLGLLGKMKR